MAMANEYPRFYLVDSEIPVRIDLVEGQEVGTNMATGFTPYPLGRVFADNHSITEEEANRYAAELRRRLAASSAA